MPGLAALHGSSLQFVAGGWNVSSRGSSEEVQVFGRPGGEMLREQGRPPGKQKPATRRERDVQLSDLKLNAVRPGMPSVGGSSSQGAPGN